MRLFGFGQSRSFRALWALEESGLSFEYVALDPASNESGKGAKGEDYRALNVHGKVPTLVDGDLVLTESAAILNHIARRAPAVGLGPSADPSEQARYDELAFFIMTELEQPLWSNGKHRFALPPEQRIPQMLDCANFEFAKALAALDRHVGEREFALGNRFTNIDILLAQTLNWAERFKFQVPAPCLAYRDRHYQRPACQRALARVTV
ncbi:MAG: hypothetical protein RLZZ385_362 [Pseudomonadota bacterium]|jgi:glutathione S-transferase